MVVFWKRILYILITLGLYLCLVAQLVESLRGCPDPQVGKFVEFDNIINNGTSWIIRLRCDKYHSTLAQNISTSECTYDSNTRSRKWMPNPLGFTCFAPCTLGKLQEGVQSPSEGTLIWHGENATFSCTKGKLLGPEISHCHDGEWIPSLIQRCYYDQGKIRLYHGRVMMRYNGLEGSICYTEEWDIHDANVVCRQLGFRPYAISVTSIPFSDIGNDIIHFDSVTCEGYEKGLAECGLSFSPCHTQAYAGVTCLENDETASEWSVRLINKNENEPSSGMVEIYHKGHWGSMCINDWTQESGHVVCRQLGYPGAVKISTDTADREVKIQLYQFKCTGDEKSINDCPRDFVVDDCEPGVAGTVVCEYPEKYSLRLMNGTSSKDGRLEIFDGAHWRAVSDTFDDDTTPALICEKLVEPGSYRKHATDGKFGNGLVAPKYSYACQRYANTLADCLVVDVSAEVTDERPISLYCDEVEKPPSMNPQLVILLSVVGACIFVVVAFFVRVWYHKKRVIYRQKSIISDRYDHLPTESDEKKKPPKLSDIKEVSTDNDDAVFTD